MKKILLAALAALLLMMTAALAETVPLTKAEIPSVPGAPNPPKIVLSQQTEAGLTVVFDRALPPEHLLSFVAMGGDYRETTVCHAAGGDGCTFTAEALPRGGEWLRIDLAWVGGENATARYSIGGGLVHMTCFDGAYNEYVYDSMGVFMEFRDAKSGVWTRFDPDGNTVRYSYEDQGMRVWFDLAGNVCWATLESDGYSCVWDAEDGWVIETPAGSVKVQVELDPRTVKPLYVAQEEPSPTPEVVWYPNNTIALAGLSLQEASPRLPDKWYNVVPIDLTRQGRQTYFLTVSNARFIGECYVDVWGDEVTVTCSVMSRSGIELKSEYGRWFTSLSQITSSSIESEQDGFIFGRPLSISEDLDGAEVALLFIRSKCTYRQPFRDGTELTRYWRNKADWKTFRKDLQELMPYVAK